MLEYVADVPAALGEMHRALRAGGRLVVWDVDWATVSLHTTDPALTERIMRSWDGHLGHPSLPQTLTSNSVASGGRREAPDAAASVVRTVVLRPARLSAYRDAVGRFVETRDEAKWIADEDREPLARLRGLLVPLEELCAEALRVALSPAPQPR